MTTAKMHFDCAKFPAYARFVEHVKRTIAESKPGTLIIYENITEQWSNGIWDTLEEDPEHQHIRKTLDTVTCTFALVVPTDIHGCHHKWFYLSQFEWMQSGAVSREDIELSSPGVGTTLNMTSGPYSGSRKEPDLFFRVDGHALPTLAIESGWSETTTKLYDDMNLLFVGGNGAIRTVFIIKWTKHADNVHVSGRIEVYGLDRNGMPVQRGPAQDIFPEPPNGQSQVIGVRRRDLFWGSPLANREPNTILPWRLDDLRRSARNSLSLMGLLPAE